VHVDDAKVTDAELVLAGGPHIIKVGKRRFARVTLS